MGFMKTRWTENINKENPLPEYPRPQLERENWLSLNGVYEYAIKPSECNWVNEYDGEIVVPFAVESLLSSVQKPLGPSERLWYKRIFTVPEKMHGKNIILNFGAVDWQCTVYINGKIVGTHTGGYCSFSFDITDYLQNENELVVCVFDPTDKGWRDGESRC